MISGILDKDEDVVARKEPRFGGARIKDPCIVGARTGVRENMPV